MYNNGQIKGFTLIEMSVVLTIISFIILGISFGGNMIKSAEARAIITEYNTYIEAINNFKLQYDSYPGDFSNASRFWSNCDSTGSNNATFCNGNSDGLIEPGYMTGPGGITVGYEGKMAWRHLMLAGMINGYYEGVTGASGGTSTAYNYPLSNNTYNSWVFDGTNAASATMVDLYNGYLGNVLTYVGYYKNGSSYEFSNGLRPIDAHNIDNKIDDGKPNSGKVAAFHRFMGTTSGANCTTPFNVWPPLSTNTYDFSQTNLNCTMYFYFSDI
jgi:prepilin-type N-terminal cleavage/methylation domain-containing protein